MPDRPASPPALTGPNVPWIIAAAAIIGSIALAVWATSLQRDLGDAEDRIAALSAERDQLRAASTAEVFTLGPTAEGPGDASGSLYLRAEGSGVLTVANLPAPDDDRVYQVWYLPPDEGAPIPGSTFSVDDRGIGFMLVSADVGAIRGVAISAEPEGGSTEPTGALLLSGSASGARG